MLIHADNLDITAVIAHRMKTLDSVDYGNITTNSALTCFTIIICNTQLLEVKYIHNSEAILKHAPLELLMHVNSPKLKKSHRSVTHTSFQAHKNSVTSGKIHIL